MTVPYSVAREDALAFINKYAGNVTMVPQWCSPDSVAQDGWTANGNIYTMHRVVDPSVGFVITARPGDWVEAGEPLATIFARDRAGIETGRQTLRNAIRIADEADPPLPLISHRVTANGAELWQG